MVAPLAASASISAASTGHRDATRSAWTTSTGVASAGRPRQTCSLPRSCWARARCSSPQASSAASANKASARSATPAAVATRRQAHDEPKAHLYLNQIAHARYELVANHHTRAERLLDETPAAARGWEWHYLKRLPDASWRDARAKVNRGVSANLDLAFHPGGELLAGPGPGNTVTLWDLTAGNKQYLPGHKDQGMKGRITVK